MFEAPVVTFKSGPDAKFSLVGADICVHEEDPIGIHLAAEALATDFGRVSGVESSLRVIKPSANKDNSEFKNARKSLTSCVLVGTLAGSPTVRYLHDNGLLPGVDDVEGKWESWVTTCLTGSPFDDYENALVVVGSDKRGAIFGAYNLAEQIGVSPYVLRHQKYQFQADSDI